MHIEVGVVQEAKMLLSYGTAVASFGFLAKLAWDAAREKGLLSLGLKSLLTTLFVFSFFEILPHYPVGVSEVHFILGSTLFLLFGIAPAGIGLALGLLLQGLFFAPFDLPNYSVNITTLLVPLFLMSALAQRIIPQNTAYKDLSYRQTSTLSVAFQGGIISWVTFWVLYGQGFGTETLSALVSFAMAYSLVIVIEPLLDLAVLAGAKRLHTLNTRIYLNQRLYHS